MSTEDDYFAFLTLRNYSPRTISKRRLALMRISRDVGHDLLAAGEESYSAWYGRLAQRVKPNSRAVELSQVRAFLKWAVEQGLIDRDPTRRLPRPKVHRRYPRPIAEDRLSLAISTASPRIRPMLVLAAYQGLRAIEIANLRREDVREDAVEPVLIVLHGKGDKERFLPLHPRVIAELGSLPREGWLFPYVDRPDVPVPSQRVSQLCNEHLHSVGVPDSLHTLRHRYGTAIYQASHDLRLTQDLLGHANPNTTAGYAAAFQPDAARAVAALV